MSASSHLPWHRLFGIALTEQFAGTPWRVELELELALRSQRLDVVLIERTPGAATAGAPALPDGLEGLRAHNLLTYKSIRESLDVWALDELLAHYVNYRKLNPVASEATGSSSPSGRGTRRLRPAEDFGLYAVTTRAPDALAARVTLQPTSWSGVYDVLWGARLIRIIVLNEIESHPRNAPWELFSADAGRIRHGLAHYRPTDEAARRLLYQLYFTHRLEFSDMAHTIEELMREVDRQIAENMTPELLRELAASMTPEQFRKVLETVPAEERVRGLPAEERLRGLPAEERLLGLAPEELERLRELLNRPN